MWMFPGFAWSPALFGCSVCGGGPAGAAVCDRAPRQAAAGTASGVDFNLVHSGDLIALAFARHRPLGIDLEQIRPFAQSNEIARRFLCAQEAEEIASLEVAEQSRASFRCWTRKEAIVKATGEGLSAPLDGFE